MKQVPLLMLLGFSIIGSTAIATSFAAHPGLDPDIGLITDVDGCTFLLDTGATDVDPNPTVTIQNDGTLVCVGSLPATLERYQNNSGDNPNHCVVGQEIASSWHQTVNNNGRAVLVCKF